MLTWRAHPALERPGSTAALVAVIAACVAIVWFAFHDPFLAALTAIFLAGALSAWFLPTTYEIDERAIVARRAGVRRERLWSEIRRVAIDARGATLSPFPRRSWLDPYRSLRVLFGGRRAEVIAALEARAPAGTAFAAGQREPAGAAAEGPANPEPAAPAGPDPEIAALIETAARAVVSRGMAAPAILLLESSKPVAFLGSQALHFLEPFVRSLFDAPRYEQLARALEDRANVERLLVRIERLEGESRHANAPARKDRGGRP